MNLINGIQLDSLLYRITALLIAIVVHDAVQASVALLLGDKTAKEQGRLTLNPLAHLSAIGLLPVLFGPFGWSRPVPVKPSQLRRNPSLHTALIYLCGPFANLALGLVLWWVTFHLPISTSDSILPVWSLELIRGILQWSYIANMMFVLLHMLPVYPMDLWKIVRNWMPASWDETLQKNEKLGIAVLIGLVITPFGQWVFQNSFEWLSGAVMNLYAMG